MKDETIITDVLDKIRLKKNVDISGAQSKIETKYKPLVDELSFISFINVSFALHLQSQLIVQTGGKSILSKELDLSKLVVKSADDIKVIKKDVGESWTTSITDFTDEIAPTLFGGNSCAENTALIINKILDTTHFLGRTKKAAAEVAEVVEEAIVVEDRVKEIERVTLDMPHLDECAALQEVAKCFKGALFGRYMRFMINHGDITDNDQRERANLLYRLSQDAKPELLDQCYVTGKDMDDNGDENGPSRRIRKRKKQ
jgi:hypothetical protein